MEYIIFINGNFLLLNKQELSFRIEYLPRKFKWENENKGGNKQW